MSGGCHAIWLSEEMIWNQEQTDPGLDFNYSCQIGLCELCISHVNGKVVLACATLANDDLLIEP